MSAPALEPFNAGHRRQAAYRARMLANGMTQVAVWVPARRVPDLYGEAQRLRKQSGLVLPGEADARQLALSFDEALP